VKPIIPGDILVFFPSYDLMHHVINLWDEQILKFVREMFLEAEGAGELMKFFERYLRMVQRGKRAMLM
jgi:Rad3-related DNA helicase